MKNWILWFLFVFGFIIIVELTARGCHAQTVDLSFTQTTKDNFAWTIQISQPIRYKQIVFEPYGGWKTWSYMDDITKNYPFLDTYTIGFKTTIFDNWYIDIQHYCTHNVMTSRDKQIDGTYSNKNWVKNGVWNQAQSSVTIGYHKTFSVIDL
jgi:hypothetical protein